MQLRRSHIYLVQAIYYFVTGLWPVIDIRSFMVVTGPKTDIWLVKMVGLLTVAIAISLYAWRNKFDCRVLAISSAAAYLSIDVYYYLNGTISAVYLLDAVAEAIIIVMLFILGEKREA